MQSDEEKRMDVNTVNFSDFLTIPCELNFDVNESLEKMLKLSQNASFVNFSDEILEKSTCKSNKEMCHSNIPLKCEGKNNELLDNSSQNSIIKSLNKSLNSKDDSGKKVPENKNCDKMAQYIIDSLFYNTLDDSPNESELSENLFMSQNTEEENKTRRNSKESSKFVLEPTQNINFNEEKASSLCVSKYPKISECKVMLQRLDNEDLQLNKSLEKSSEKILPVVDKLNVNEIKHNFERSRKKKLKKRKNISLGSLSILTYNFKLPPSKSILNKTSIKTYSFSSRMKNNLIKQKNISNNNLPSNRQQKSTNKMHSLFSSNFSEKNKHGILKQSEIVIGEKASHKNKSLETKLNNSHSKVQVPNTDKQVLQLKNCSVKIEKLPILYFKKLFSNKNLNFCFLCDDIKLFLSRNGLVSHLKEVHCDEIICSQVNHF